MSINNVHDWSHTWYPCSQMKDYEQFPMLNIKSARGSELTLDDGSIIIDAIASWWCKSLGHGHPKLRAALLDQLEKFEHVIMANTNHPVLSQLSQRLARLSPSLDKVFYAGDGSCAVEIAMKMSLHAQQLLGQSQRTRFITLENGYHGETSGALSVSDVGIYRTPYQSMLFEPHVLRGLPYVANRQDPQWQDIDALWPALEAQLMPWAQTASALLVEPIVQGAGGMHLYSADLLRKLRLWCSTHGVHLIADEIMTGIGRTGLMLACQHASIEPDFVCLSKGLTSGWLPLSAVLTRSDIYALFYDDYHTGKAFLHSHTYSGNALAASVALACLQVMEEENLLAYVPTLETSLLQHMQQISDVTGKLTRVRGIGGIVAADLVVEDAHQRAGHAVYQAAVTRGALLRPIGNTLYWLPPLNIESASLQRLQDITIDAIRAVLP